MTLEIQIRVRNRHKNVAVLNRIVALQPFPLYNSISYCNPYTNKRFHSKRSRMITKINDNISTDNQLAGSMKALI